MTACTSRRRRCCKSSRSLKEHSRLRKRHSSAQMELALTAKCMHACTKSQGSLDTTNPTGSSNLGDQLNGIFHEKSSVSSHHQSAPLSLRGLDGRNNALDEILGIMRVLLEHSHPLPQAAGAWLLVAVRVGLDNTDFHHFAPLACLCDPGANRDVTHVTLPTYTHAHTLGRLVCSVPSHCNI